MPQTNMLYLFVVNPISGGKTKEGWETAIRDHCRDQPFNTEIFLLSGNDDTSSLRHYVETLKPHKIVAVGGDGTVKMVAELIAGLNIPLGIIPAGSANGMARELGIPVDVKQALEVVINGYSKKIDIIKVNGEHHCLHLSDLGLNARLVKYFEKHSGRGKLSYGRFIFKALWRKKKLSFKITTDKETFHRDAFMVVLANARMYGTGAVINPHGDVSDGIFEIVLLRQLSFIELLKMLLRVKSFNPKKTEILTVKNVMIELASPAHFQVDGEYLGKTMKVKAETLPGYMQVMVPDTKTNSSNVSHSIQ
ncbi:MAG: diacylglycerol kinase [Chitinophagaceae bacterium]|nr:diacylglycerol kinase [Chitinophagaceae bacterium]